MEACLLTDQDRMAMIASKGEDAYEDRKPEGIKKEGEDNEEEEEDYEVDLQAESSSTLRQTAGYTLTRLTGLFHGEIFQVLQSYIENGMSSGKNELIEPSVLVLGIILEDDFSGIPNIEGIVTFLMSLLQNQYPVLRSTTLWTLSKLSSWTMQNPQYQSPYI